MTPPAPDRPVDRSDADQPVAVSAPSDGDAAAFLAEVARFRAAHPDIRQVDALIPDSCGVLRGKKMPAEKLDALATEGVGFPGSLYATDIAGDTVEETGLGFADGDADRTCVPVPGTLYPVPWAERPTGQILLSMRGGDGAPFFADPRAVLTRVVDRLRADGLHAVVAIELEFYLLDRQPGPDGRPRPPVSPMTGLRQSTTQVYGIEELYDFDALLYDVTEAARAQDIPVDSIVSEYAPGQYEINLHHVADPIAACDDAVMFKRVVKGVAARHGLGATFMAKPFAEMAGNGLHVHLSLLDDAGRNVFSDAAPEGSAVLRHAIGGLAATMAEGMALFAQNQNAYRRFQAHSYAPHAPTWGVNNRSAALRIPAGKPEDRRVEHRVAGADSNPYLVMAAVLAGAHHGIRNRLDPGAPITGNAYESVQPVLTSSWLLALDLLDESETFAALFGRDFLEVYLALKRAERERFFATITPLEYDWYLNKV
ncbi:MAG: glutamine synthetase [Alphaproteobacteria bacterium]|jgi:glutamine synthetase|nr:glutamine synthetase [Alphaproteobacteria bacterium]